MQLSLKRSLLIAGIILALLVAGFIYLFPGNTQPAITNQIGDEQVKLSNNETLQVFRAAKPEKGVLIYIADKSHDNKIADYAKQFASLSYYVAVLDKDALLSSPANTETHCLDLAKKIGDINTQLQKHYQLDDEELPILAGTDQSSAVVYAVLAQAEGHKFHAAVSINFSTDLKVHTALCEQEKFVNTDKLIAIKRLPTSFYVFQDTNAPAESAKFAENIGNVKLTIAADQKQNAQAEAIQILQWLDPRLADQISSDASDSDLPLIEVPVTESANIQASESLVVLLTGDGGWAEIDKSLAKILADKGIPTVALDSLSYFWKQRTPQETAKDIEDTISHYLDKWNKKRAILIGYSFGADVLPFVANNLTTETQQKISLIALLGMGKTAAFEFRLSSWMNADKNPNRLPILPEFGKMKWANTICIYGVDDDAANCLPTAELGVKIISMPGDHHFDERYDELVQHILDNEKAR
ncbi:virulence protein [Cellvibrio zantedeschiae]|uniref:Virulence protein n=1 Tax=Cellvibrio zantedeschiae TaxID=1237077 RepID=A0ABQ3B3L6_9GAMM|nr:virulence factor family protein [Cellvibrio zantedeschiae]GGY72367.1 virulence protein [Cellvibrio zantedeschiae]